MHLSKLENLDDLAMWAYIKILMEMVVERDIGAQETCHMLLQLPLVECNRNFVNLNVSCEVFKPVVINDDGNEEKLTKSFVDGYKRRPLCMEGIYLIDATRS